MISIGGGERREHGVAGRPGLGVRRGRFFLFHLSDFPPLLGPEVSFSLLPFPSLLFSPPSLPPFREDVRLSHEDSSNTVVTGLRGMSESSMVKVLGLVCSSSHCSLPSCRGSPAASVHLALLGT